LVAHRDQEKLDKKSKPTISHGATTKDDIIKPLSWRKIRGKKNGNSLQSASNPNYADNSKKKISTTSFSTSSTTALTPACHARGLVAAHSRKLSATLGGSTSTRPWVRKLILKIYDFVDIGNATIPNNARGLDNNLASDRGCDSTTSTRRPLRP
jgi:hypothetical protein